MTPFAKILLLDKGKSYIRILTEFEPKYQTALNKQNRAQFRICNYGYGKADILSPKEETDLVGRKTDVAGCRTDDCRTDA